MGPSAGRYSTRALTPLTRSLSDEFRFLSEELMTDGDSDKENKDVTNGKLRAIVRPRIGKAKGDEPVDPSIGQAKGDGPVDLNIGQAKGDGPESPMSVESPKSYAPEMVSNVSTLGELGIPLPEEAPECLKAPVFELKETYNSPAEPKRFYMRYNQDYGKYETEVRDKFDDRIKYNGKFEHALRGVARHNTLVSDRIRD